MTEGRTDRRTDRCGFTLQCCARAPVRDILNVHFRLPYLGHLHIVIRRLAAIVARLPLPLVADTLDEVLVEVADVEMSNLQTMKSIQQMSEQNNVSCSNYQHPFCSRKLIMLRRRDPTPSIQVGEDEIHYQGIN